LNSDNYKNINNLENMIKEKDKEISNLKTSLEWDKSLKDALVLLIKRTPSIGGIVQSIKDDINNYKYSEKIENINDLPTTDIEIINKENVLVHGLTKYTWIYKQFSYPIKSSNNSFITSEYGPGWIWNGKKDEFRYHSGIDIVNPFDLSILSIADGRIIKVGFNQIYGNYIIINHDDGYQSFYGHLSHVLVKEYSYVNKGDLIGVQGNTGNSYGTHLHFELRQKKGYYYVALNPFINSTWNSRIETDEYKITNKDLSFY
jgi:murein DD-endopeptidase MepM/ murein hydrolase activator NlpD